MHYKTYRLISILLLLTSSVVSFGQNASDTLAKDNVLIPLPTISVNVGFNHGFTDVSLSSKGPSPFRQLGYQLTITQRVVKFLDLSLELYTGSVLGEEQRGTTNLNYRTSLFSQHLNVEYNFFPLLKPKANGRQLIRPYVGFGIGAVFFRSKGDLINENGVAYQYWSDGMIYAEVEGSVDPSEATVLERDFEYETDLRDANLDGFRKYSQTAFTMPFNAGIRFQISKNVGINASFAYVLNFTDLIDNVNDQSLGVRSGNSGYDNHLFGSVGVSIFLGTTKPSAKPVPRFDNLEVKSNGKPSDSENSVKPKIESEKKDALVALTEQLSAASESIRKISEASEQSLVDNSQQITAITKLELSSKKELKDAKRESIKLIEKSILELAETSSELNQTANNINSASTDLSSNNLENKFSSAEKLKAVVEETVPTMESLKAQIAASSSSEELKSVLNITTRNLLHTKEILAQESTQVDESILIARKTVARARTEQVLSKNLNSIEQIEAVKEELDALRDQGVLEQAEYQRLLITIDQSNTELAKSNGEEIINEQSLENTNLAAASQLLKNAMIMLAQTNELSNESLSKRRNELTSLAETTIDTKKDLKAAKEEAIKILETALENLNLTKASLIETTSDLKRANKQLDAVNSEDEMVDFKIVESSVSTTTTLLESSKETIRSSNNSEELKSVLRLAATNLNKTKDVISSESSSISTSLDVKRKNLIIDEIKYASTQPTQVDDNESFKNVVLQDQLEKLKEDGLVNNEEYADMKASLGSNQNSSTPNELIETEEPNEVIAPAISESNEALVSENQQIDDKKDIFSIESIAESEPKQTGTFLWADLDKNNWISPSEVLHFIDLLFEGEAVRSVSDIQDLIDYYFDQE